MQRLTMRHQDGLRESPDQIPYQPRQYRTQRDAQLQAIDELEQKVQQLNMMRAAQPGSSQLETIIASMNRQILQAKHIIQQVPADQCVKGQKFQQIPVA